MPDALVEPLSESIEYARNQTPNVFTGFKDFTKKGPNVFTRRVPMSSQEGSESSAKISNPSRRRNGIKYARTSKCFPETTPKLCIRRLELRSQVSFRPSGQVTHGSQPSQPEHQQALPRERAEHVVDIIRYVQNQIPNVFRKRVQMCSGERFQKKGPHVLRRTVQMCSQEGTESLVKISKPPVLRGRPFSRWDPICSNLQMLSRNGSESLYPTRSSLW